MITGMGMITTMITGTIITLIRMRIIRWDRNQFVTASRPARKSDAGRWTAI